ncbi:putative defense protein 3 [Pomacea canaliculata]|uniref:putative defense protein 3 n=1 Tax=Pomacea canaliculata TaxID=400727 RepID=UPI000D727164|nr:putative defense protein 3 [Pomacea canaliculata]
MQSWVVLLSAVLLSCCGPSLAYPDGAPTEACTNMFPSGHHADAQSSTPPYELTVSSTSLTASNVYTVTLKVKSGQTTTFKGLFVQARLADNCNNTSPHGTFTVPSDGFLKLTPCTVANDAVTQINDIPQTTKTFNWTSPSSIPGTVYFRATVVYNEKTFWTDVSSDFLRPSGATGTPQVCTVQKTSGGAAVAATVLLTTVLALTSFALVL